MTHSEDERRALLTGLGLNPDAPALGKAVKKSKSKAKVKVDPDEIVLAPPGVDPHSMPVDDIVFDPRLLDKYADLSFSADGADASRDIFKLYKSPYKNTERHGALNRKITSFITQERRNRATGGMVKEKVASTKEQRDNAALLASQGVTSTDLAEALRLLQEKRGIPQHD
jgi:hypothetical protein